MSWEVQSRNGIHLPQVGWWLDAPRPAARSLVTHAHSDHVAAHREIICTAATARLMRLRVPGRRVEHVLPFGHAEQLTADCAVTLLPAGHILGSAQVLLEHTTHGRLLYTGDFKLRPSPAAEPCATPRADVLIMETTFGLPRYRMPATDAVVGDLIAFCRQTLAGGATPVLYAYALGKTQELLMLLGAAGLPVMLSRQAMSITRAYEQLGLALPPYAEFHHASYAGHVIVTPPQAPFLDLVHPKRTAAVTGWALDSRTKYQYACDAAFPLSDHADFDDLLAFVERVAPRRVLTVHGFAREFAQTLRRRGLDAWALGRENQLELAIDD